MGNPSRLPRYAVVVAGGKGLRMGKEIPKQFIELRGKPILAYTIDTCCSILGSDRVILVLPESHQDLWHGWLKVSSRPYSPALAIGGNERHQSVVAGLIQIPEKEAIVAILDAVRPFSGEKLLAASLDAAEEYGSGVAAVSVTDSLRMQTHEGWKHVPRSSFKAIQTPQSFQLSTLREAYAKIDGSLYTDDASVFEAAGNSVHLVEGHYQNIKLTTPIDLALAESILASGNALQ